MTASDFEQFSLALNEIDYYVCSSCSCSFATLGHLPGIQSVTLTVLLVELNEYNTCITAQLEYSIKVHQRLHILTLIGAEYGFVKYNVQFRCPRIIWRCQCYADAVRCSMQDYVVRRWIW